MTDSPSESDRPRVFISYSSEDASAARLIRGSLAKDFDTYMDAGRMEPGGAWSSRLLDDISSTDSVVLLLSDSVAASAENDAEIRTLASESRSRDIDVVPVLLEKIEIPSVLQGIVAIDLSEEGALGVGRLIVRLLGAQAINFETISPQDFERMTSVLLTAEGYDVSAVPDREAGDRGYDLVAHKGSEMWVVQAKHYSQSRLSVNLIRRTLLRLEEQAPPGANLLLVTSTQPTSVALQYLLESSKSRRIEILDRVRLEQMLLEHPPVLEEFFLFSGRGRVQ